MPKPPNPYKRELSAWRVMKRRCLDPRHKYWPRYGGVGIRVCPEWTQSFARFLEDMGPAPTQRHWLGRLDVRGNYEPANCVWTTRDEQMRRRAYCRRLTLHGQTMTAAEAARLPGQPSRNSVLRRLEHGLPLDNPPAPRLLKASMWLTFNGETLPLPVWAQRIGLPASLLWLRVHRGMPLDKALTPRRFRNHARVAGVSSKPTS